ncbi:MAG: 50S ribosomal protein L20 [Candidatus Absconditabacterales bacterium]
MRVKNGLQRHKKHRKLISLAKGYRLGRGNVYKQVQNAVVKAGQHAYEDRKLKKRDQRRLWIERLSAALQARGSKYSVFIKQASDKRVLLNRKMLSNIAIVFPNVFDAIFEQVSK